MHFMTKNYVLKPIYNDKNECINDTLSDDDLHRGVLYQPLIEDETSTPMATPKFAYLSACSSTKN